MAISANVGLLPRVEALQIAFFLAMLGSLVTGCKGPKKCHIGGTTYSAGAVNPANPCQVCAPSKSTTAWSNRANGTACGGGKTCCGGKCVDTSTDPLNCGACGKACGQGSTCSGGVCSSSKCTIGGTAYSAGAANPANPCQVCTPSKSTTAWSNQANGTACGGGKTCCGGTCVDTSTDPLNCGACGKACGQGSTCSGGVCSSSSGACTVGQPPPGAIDAQVAYGATGNPNNTTGSDTEAINKAILAAAAVPGGGTVYLKDGTYMIRADRLPPPNTSVFAPEGGAGIQLKSNVTLFLSANAVLQALPSSSARYAVVVVPPGATNVTIKGGRVVGDFGVHLTSNIGQPCTTQNKMCAAYGQYCLSGVCGAGEWGHGIHVIGASGVNIVGVHVSKTWGDGIELGYENKSPPTLSSNISLCGVVVDNARRNGMAIIGASDVQVTNSTFQHTGNPVNGQAGTSPKTGCDVEPDVGSAHGISLQHCRFTDNASSGLIMSGNAPNTTVTNNSVSDSVMGGNGDFGLLLGKASSVSVSNNVIQGNAGYGVMLMTAWSTSIVGNTISGNAYGVVSSYGSHGNLIRSNIISGSTMGVLLANASQETVQENTIQNNTSNGVALGYSTDPATQSSVTGNSLNNNGVAMSITNQSSGNTVTGNTCTGAGSALVIYAGSGTNFISMNAGCTQQ